AFTCVIYELAMRPEYVQPLRDEIEKVIAEGWSMDAVRKLWKVESGQLHQRVSTVVMRRKALKDFTFSDGMAIPAGTSVSIPYVPVHTDPASSSLSERYPKNFDGFRFEKMRKQNGEDSKHQFVSLSVDYILFGHGRHACTGRFFMATEMKVLLAHILLKYNVKMADGQGQPKNWQFGRYSGPDTTAKILFHKRREA
ncbi:Cytochrome P450, partial [Amanita muscaria]